MEGGFRRSKITRECFYTKVGSQYGGYNNNHRRRLFWHGIDNIHCIIYSQHTHAHTTNTLAPYTDTHTHITHCHRYTHSHHTLSQIHTLTPHTVTDTHTHTTHTLTPHTHSHHTQTHTLTPHTHSHHTHTHTTHRHTHSHHTLSQIHTLTACVCRRCCSVKTEADSWVCP